MSGYDRNAASGRASRSAVLARNGIVCTSQPLASAAGLRVLQQGGNAIDAAITAAAVLNVVEPMMTGIGGDAFAIVYWSKEGRLVGLNASGRSPAGMTVEYLRNKGYTHMPQTGVDTITVPGALDGWDKILRRFGTIALAQALAPAIEYAENGFPVSEIIANQWAAEARKLHGDADAAATYLANGQAPRHGDIAQNKNLGRTFRTIAAAGARDLYEGSIAEMIAAAVQARGGVMTVQDLAAQGSEWVEPAGVHYKGFDCFELPPNGQGIVALQMLNILQGFDLKRLGHNSADYLHLLVEAKKLAFADRDRFIADPQFAQISVRRLLSKAYAEERRRLIDPERAAPEYPPGKIENGDTVYLTAVDKDLNVVSLINSIFSAFGSGIVAGDTGICLQNRGAGFRMEESSLNRIEPRKRPLHTIIPAMVMKDEKPWLSFGVMGGDNQPQGHVQVFLNMVEFGMNVQETGDAARFRHTGGELGLESGIGAGVRRDLVRRGHKVVTMVDAWGGYQGILIDHATGVLMGGSDPRKDGCAIGW